MLVKKPTRKILNCKLKTTYKINILYEGEDKMNKKNINYSLISVISSEQLILRNYINHTDFAKDNSVYQGGTVFLIKSNLYNDINNSILYGLVCVKDYGLGEEEYKYNIYDRKLDCSFPFGIIPTIPYKLVSKIAKLNDKGLYELGHYPQVYFPHYYAEIYNFFNSNESEFLKPLKEKFSLPMKEYNKKQVKVKSFDVYKIRNNEDKVVWNGQACYKIEPVEWIKYGDNLICSKVLFYSPIHMKNDYVQCDDIKSFDDTFLKWYIDNIFTSDLFKYTDLSYIKEQIPIVIDEDIDTKLKEIERLKKIKANLILQKPNEEHIIDTAHRNIYKLFEGDSKEQVVKTLHK